MSKPGVIVIEGHVQGLSNTRAFGELGVPVYVIDTGNCISKYSKHCTEFFYCPPYHRNELADFLIELAEKYELNDWLLFPSNDNAALTISRNKNRLKNHFKFLVPEYDIFQNIYDKSRLLKLASAAGIFIPITNFNDQNHEINPNLVFPVITKGRFGLDFYKKTGRKAFFAQTFDELNKQLKQISSVISLDKTLTQEVIEDDGKNKTVSFTAFCLNGEIKTYWMGMKLREHPERFGTATFAKSIKIPECYDLSAILLNKLNYTGICEIEYIQDPKDDNFKLIEINPRTWLWVELAKISGINYAKITYDYVHNNPINYPHDYKIDLNWINPFTDLVYSLLAILKRRLSLMSYIESLKKDKVNALYYNDDKKPVFMYLLLILKFLRNR